MLLCQQEDVGPLYRRTRVDGRRCSADSKEYRNLRVDNGDEEMDGIKILLDSSKWLYKTTCGYMCINKMSPLCSFQETHRISHRANDTSGQRINISENSEAIVG